MLLRNYLSEIIFVMESLRLALDWTPNVNHIGILVALEQGYFKEQDINLTILDPAEDNYTITPGKKLELGTADLAIAPFETIISLNNKQHPVDAIGIYAILQEDISSIVTLEGSGFDRPATLAGKRYASYKARYEDHIVQAMVRNDGGTENMECLYPDKLGIWNTVLDGKADATWIFDNWEGVEAKTRGIKLHKFKLSDYSIPYGYSPVILGKKQTIEQHLALYKKAVAAIEKGYLFTIQQPRVATEILKLYVTPSEQERIDLLACTHETIPYLGKPDALGRMDAQRVHRFLEWLVKNDLESDKILTQSLFTNELFKS